MGNVSVNGVEFEIPDVAKMQIINGKLVVNGEEITDIRDKGQEVKISVSGSITSLSCDQSVSVRSRSIGSIEAKGSVNCDDVHGNVTAGGSVNCDNVEGDVKAGGSVNCDDVSGSVSAGGSVRCSSAKNKGAFTKRF